MVNSAKLLKKKRFESCSSVTQSQVMSKVLLRVQDSVLLYFVASFKQLQEPYDTSSGKSFNLPLPTLSDKAL